MPLSITRPRVPSFPAEQPFFGRKIFSIPRIIPEIPSLRRVCPSKNVSIKPAFVTQKNIASIDNSCHKPVPLTHPLPVSAPIARHAQPQFPFNRCGTGFAASATSSRHNSGIRKGPPFPDKKILRFRKRIRKEPSVPRALFAGGQCLRDLRDLRDLSGRPYLLSAQILYLKHDF